MPSNVKPPTAKLALEDGTVYTGTSFGASGEIDGEVVFNTAMTGYQEILTDPSYRGQLVTMTYPQIGNYGINQDDLESEKPHLAGFIVRENSRVVSNFRSEGDLNTYLKKHNIIALTGIDTRALVRRLRSEGAMKGVLSTTDLDDTSLVTKAKMAPGLIGRDLVREVMPANGRQWKQPLHPLACSPDTPTSVNSKNFHVVALDFGMKWNIPRHLAQEGCQVTVLPGTTTAEEILNQNPDGLFLSNGPGDPEPLSYAISTIEHLLGKLPIFGICLGHQLLALACKAKTFKLKFGHRGANQPVLCLATNKVEITSQNHGFAVSEEDLPDSLEITHRNLNDNTIAGLRHKEHPAFSVQYHPESSAGPHDSRYLFQEFLSQMALFPANN
ncbi:MAG: glutamine-hydrolyzing carbamoyl-phosphate synthase small subunit [Pirellulaceae bacterium]|nr:glutamine-hydrolyzing carbamoyl-phosphate synthase small subunit [Pirellulaceae bacterium]